MKKLLVLVFCLGLATAANAGVIYEDTFEGLATDPLNGATTSGGGGTWSANTIAMADGTIASGAGMALLPFDPVANQVYTLSLDLTDVGANGNWISLGFARDPLIAPGTSRTSDRFTNDPEGIATMIYRDKADDTADISVWGGLRTGNAIADTGVWAAGTHTLKIILDTTGDGSSFTADFQIDGSTITAGAQPVPLAVADINYAAFGAAGNVSGSIDNFSLVPEPATMSLLALGGLGALVRRRRNR